MRSFLEYLMEYKSQILCEVAERILVNVSREGGDLPVEAEDKSSVT